MITEDLASWLHSPTLGLCRAYSVSAFFVERFVRIIDSKRGLIFEVD